jgi:hypothetical protein
MADLDKNTVRVLRGFSKLDYTNRNELLTILRDYQENIDNTFRGQLMEKVAARAGVPLGPTSEGGCPCCGK